MKNTATLELRGISKTYGNGRQVLSDLSYTLAAGEYVAIMGDSGVGKSTLLNLIAGLDAPDTGEIWVDDIALSANDDDAATLLRRRHFGFIFQAFHVLPHLTLLQNVSLPLLLNHLPLDRAETMLTAVGLKGREQDFPRQLSGGELQRVAIARALVHRPRLILADEPTGNLDPDTAQEILQLMRAEIKANGAAGIIVTHSQAARHGRSYPAADQGWFAAARGWIKRMNRDLLFRWLTLGEWQAHRLQIVVSIVAIMLGIAMGFSIHLINTAAVSEFSAAIKSLSGQSDFQVRATQPTFDEMLYPKLAQHAGVAQASPVLEIQAAIPGKADEIRNTTLKILGIDMLRAITVTPDLLGVPAEDRPFDMLMEDAIFLSPAAMEWLEVKEGGALPLRLGTKTVTLRVAGGLVRAHAGQRIAVMDIGAAQWHFDHVGVLSRIDLKLKQGISHEGFKAALERELPNHYLVIETADQEKRIHNMSRAYRINLNVLALVALFTGTFLVFSAQVLSTLRRRPQFALLRVLGLTRKQILWQILRESSLLGIMGSLLGLGFGYVLAATALRAFGGDLGGGFFPEIQPSVQFNPMAALLFFVLGVGVTLLGSLMPAWEAARAHPAPALKSGSEEIALAGLRKPWPAYSCLVLAAILTQLPPVAELPVFGYFSVALLMIGGILWMPSLASIFFTWLFNVFNRLSSGALAGLALARLANAPQQSHCVERGAVSFSLMVAMAIMVAVSHLDRTG